MLARVLYVFALLCLVAQSFSHNLISGVDFGIRQGGVMAPREIRAHAGRDPRESGSAPASRACLGPWMGPLAYGVSPSSAAGQRLTSQGPNKVALAHPGLGPQACVDQISIRGRRGCRSRCTTSRPSQGKFFNIQGSCAALAETNCITCGTGFGGGQMRLEACSCWPRSFWPSRV